ncbi:TPA: sugar ABC transporter permease, partial [Listeria monocytogenes]|nr:sugar ABC transporter permease [Listeria monocytogenes]
MRDFMKDQRTTKFLTQFFTYLFLTVLTIIILYPILITASSAFKPGNIAAFTLEWSDSW